ncbi:hypothetical protein C8Q79DRAFT_630586 [Trametes meyenii]|nr:hypothetical protein C8Q79DRAFT_630586 [Trametes meyenii]
MTGVSSYGTARTHIVWPPYASPNARLLSRSLTRSAPDCASQLCPTLARRRTSQAFFAPVQNRRSSIALRQRCSSALDLCNFSPRRVFSTFQLTRRRTSVSICAPCALSFRRNTQVLQPPNRRMDVHTRNTSRAKRHAGPDAGRTQADRGLQSLHQRVRCDSPDPNRSWAPAKAQRQAGASARMMSRRVR